MSVVLDLPDVLDWLRQDAFCEAVFDGIFTSIIIIQSNVN